MSAEKFSLGLNTKSFLMKHATPPPYLFQSHLFISYPSMFTSPMTAALVLLAIRQSASILGNRLLMFKWRKCKPLCLKFAPISVC